MTAAHVTASMLPPAAAGSGAEMGLLVVLLTVVVACVVTIVSQEFEAHRRQDLADLDAEQALIELWRQVEDRRLLETTDEIRDGFGTPGVAP